MDGNKNSKKYVISRICLQIHKDNKYIQDGSSHVHKETSVKIITNLGSKVIM